MDDAAHPKHREALLSAILCAAPDFLVQVDVTGVILYANRPIAPSGGAAAVGSSWLALVSSDDRERARAADALAAVVATGAPCGLETRGEATDGGFTICATRIAPTVVDGVVTGAVIVSHDVTADKHLEAQLLRSDRISSVGSLVAGVAHELNNPLSVVIANLDLAMRRLQRVGDVLIVPEVALEELRDAAECADTVKHIVRDLEVFSRSESEQLGPVDVHRAIEATLRMAWNEIRHRAQIVRAFGAVPPALANPARLGQLLLALIVNAAQAIEEGNHGGNTIRIATSVDDDGRIVIAIRDTGAGIPVGLHHRIFAPFFTTKPLGVGLGLTICKRIVALLGGDLGFESEVGRGSEFTVRIPAAAAPSDAVKRGRKRAAATRAPRARVLVVDDDRRVARTIMRVLSEHHDVIAVDSAEAGLARIDAGERFDVILCDLMMPQMTGVDFMTTLEARAPGQAARIVFVTGGTFTPRARAFLELDRHRRIDKPFRPQALRGVVVDVLTVAGR